MSVLVSGGFDPLHNGHVDYLRQAKSYGSGFVECCLASDEEVARKHPVFLPFWDRAGLFLSLRLVDWITPMTVVDRLKDGGITHYVKGKDWEGKLPDEQVQICASEGIQIVFTNTKTHSSSQLLQGPSIDEFERLVLSQKPAEKPWEPTAAVPYDLESRRLAEGCHPQLIKDVFQPQNALDVGCGPGHLVTMLEELGVKVMGWDKHHPDHNYNVDIAEPGEVSDCDAPGLSGWLGNGWQKAFDLVICREVLEHLTLREIRRAVRNLCVFSSRHVYLTTRFNPAPRSLFDVQTADDLDPTHISLLPMDLLRSWFVLEGFRRRADLEAKMDWKKLNRCLVYERA